MKPKYEIRDVKISGSVGAGSVVPFTPRGDTLPILVPVGTPEDAVGMLMVSGPSLEDLGIYDGDVLVIRRNFTRKDITPDTICIVRTISTGDILAKKVMFTHSRIVLRSSGGGFTDAYHDPADIEIQGIVFSFVRLLDRTGRFPKASDPDIPF